ncbi:MAG: efflux transporter outer membrane subunit [bacterium]|nr:efflux transporter outer membrane subunit [bacterium]
MSFPYHLGILLCGLLLSACLHQPVPTQPLPLQTPTAWQHTARAAPASAQSLQENPPYARAWWPQYGQEPLNQAVQLALTQQGNVQAAALRVRNALLRTETQTANLWPLPSGSLSTGYNRSLTGNGTSSRSAGASVGADWEIDLWGKLRQQRDMSQWEQEATMQDHTAAILTLAANVVRQYWQLAAINQRLHINRQSLDHSRKTLQFVTIQHDAGAAAGLEVAQARQNLQAQEMALIGLQQQRQEARHTLALLLGITPSNLPRSFEPDNLPQDAAGRPHINPGLPAQVLSQRPDLAAAELRLRATLANVQVQQRTLYPALSLSGTLSSGGSALAKILQNPAAALSAGLSLPFLDVGALRRNPRIAKNEYEEACIGFRQNLLQAIVEVENGLSAEQSLAENQQRQVEILAQLRHIENLAEVRYRAGQTELRHWLDAQEAGRQAELALADVHLNRLLTQSNLFQALGWGAPAFADTAIPALRDELQ